MNNKRFKTSSKKVKEMKHICYRIADRAVTLCPYIDKEKLIDRLWFCMNSLVCCTQENWVHQLQKEDEAFKNLIADISKIDVSNPLAILDKETIFTMISVMGS